MSSKMEEVPLAESENEKAALEFPVVESGLEDAESKAVVALKEIAETNLYHWKSFAISLPIPMHPEKGPLDKIFVVPDFDEVHEVAERAQQSDSPISEETLIDIRKRGELYVPSLRFRGQRHVWQLNSFIQKGSEKARFSFKSDISLGLSLVLVTARDRIQSDLLSLKEAGKALQACGLALADLMFGIPMLNARFLDDKMAEERAKFLIVELVCKDRTMESHMDSLVTFLKEKIYQLEENLTPDREEESAPILPTIPYEFRTPKGSEIDLRLFNVELMGRVLPILHSILENESKGWFIPFRDQTVARLQVQKLCKEEVEKEGNRLIMDEYLRRVYSCILSNEELESFGNGIPRLLVEQAKTVITMRRSLDNVRETLHRLLDEREAAIKAEHALLSGISGWRRAKLAEIKDSLNREVCSRFHEEAISLARDHNLNQTMYFLSRDQSFMKERYPVLMKELECLRPPCRTFSWRAQIWRPTRWEIKKKINSHEEAIPVVVSNVPMSVATNIPATEKPSYTLRQYSHYKTHTGSYGWRWRNAAFRLWSWLFNVAYILGYHIPWLSPVSVRALFCKEPFPSALMLNHAKGVLCPNADSKQLTLYSRIIKLWKSVRRVRERYEAHPPNNFLGPDVSRFLHKVWAFGIIGGGGSFLLCLIFPIICLLLSAGGFILAVTSPFWMTPAVLIYHLTMVLFFDIDSPHPAHLNWQILPFFRAVFLHGLFLGIGQGLVALLLAFFTIVASGFIFAAAGIRYGCRLAWDWLTFHTWIRRRIGVPETDSFMLKRICGPGMRSQDFVYRINPNQALVALELRLELEELNAFAQAKEEEIRIPLDKYSNFIFRSFQPFGGTLDPTTRPYAHLLQETEAYYAQLRAEVDSRSAECTLPLSSEVRHKVRLEKTDLQVVLMAAGKICQSFFPKRVFPLIYSASSSEEDETEADPSFWESRSLMHNDWQGLASVLLSEVFSPAILQPIKKQDIVYDIKVVSGDFERFGALLDMMAGSISPESEVEEVVEEGDDASNKKLPAKSSTSALTIPSLLEAKKKNISLVAPCIDIDIFNPVPTLSGSGVAKFISGTPFPLGGTLGPAASRIQIPLPVPHPAMVSAVVYNRDSDDSVPMDSALCKKILSVLMTWPPSEWSSQVELIKETLLQQEQQRRQQHLRIPLTYGGRDSDDGEDPMYRGSTTASPNKVVVKVEKGGESASVVFSGQKVPGEVV